MMSFDIEDHQGDLDSESNEAIYIDIKSGMQYI